ncbi:hypothetical protein ABXS75_12380 [Roseburia hominis]
MFFKKEVVDEDTRRQYAKEIDSLIGQGRSKEAHAKTKELEKMDKDAAGYFMSYFYFVGEVERENPREALKRIEGYIKRVPNDGDAYLMLGNIQQSFDNDEKTAAAYEKAVELGNTAALTMLAGIYYLHANTFRNQAAGTLNPRQYADCNGRAISLYIRCMELYNKAFHADKKLLEDTDWQAYGRSTDMMYVMSLNGEVKNISKADLERASILSIGASVVSGKANVREQVYWRNQAVGVTAQMEESGFCVMAEYFRASFCLYDCEKKKQEMLLNAKYHLDRAKEFSPTLNAEQRESYPSDFKDVLQMYDKTNAKLGKAMQNHLRAGELPHLELDYLPDRIPGIEDNKVYADYLAQVKSGEAVAEDKQSGTGRKKGLFGRFF